MGAGSNVLLQLRKEINSLMDKEERMWRQQSHALYLKEGDRNTRFFHCRATQRKRRNSISSIKNRDEEWCTQANQISAIFIEYYQQLFTSSNPEALEADLDSIPHTMTKDMNASLCCDFKA